MVLTTRGISGFPNALVFHSFFAAYVSETFAQTLFQPFPNISFSVCSFEISLVSPPLGSPIHMIIVQYFSIFFTTDDKTQLFDV